LSSCHSRRADSPFRSGRRAPKKRPSRSGLNVEETHLGGTTNR
jgi:hypothetical protein